MDALALDRHLGDPAILDRLQKPAERDFRLALRLPGHHRPQQQSHQDQEEPETEVAGDRIQIGTDRISPEKIT